MFGLEAQGDWADYQVSSANLLFPESGTNRRIDAFGLFTGQVGCAVNKRSVLRQGRCRR